MTALEVLRIARARLNNEPYVHRDWRTCACGHIYASATGAEARRGRQVTEAPRGAYAEALRAVVRANGLNATRDPALTVSQAVTTEARKAGWNPWDEQGSRKHGALILVERAIAMLEAEYERDRLDVLAQTRDIVDSAQTAEEAPVEVVA